jgi:hypothetical protein
MLSPVEIAAVVAATKGAIDIFDKIAGQVKSVLTKRPKEAQGDEDRWRYKIRTEATSSTSCRNAEFTLTITT